MVTMAQVFANIFCVVLLLILISGIISEQESREKNVFLTLVFLAMVYIQCSTLWWVLGGGVARHRIYCVLSRCLCACVGYACFQYLYMMTVGRSCRSLLALIPGILLIGLSVASLRTGWLFWVDGNNQYQLGSLYVLDRVLANAYYVIVAAVSLARWRTSRNPYVRRRTMIAASVAVPVLFVEMIQLLSPSLDLHGYGVVLAICSVFIRLQKHTVNETLQALQIQRENATRYRNTVLSNAVQFMVVNLTGDTLMELCVPQRPEITLDGMLHTGRIPSRRYTDTVRIWNQSIVGLTQEEKDGIFLPETLLRRFAQGESRITEMFRVASDRGILWCRQEMILTQNSQTGDVVATMTVYDVTQQKNQDQAYENQQKIIRALASGVSAYWILDWENEQVLDHHVENDRIQAFSQRILSEGTYTKALQYIFDTVVDRSSREEMLGYVRVEEIRRRLTESDRYAPPLYLSAQGFYFQMAYSVLYVGERKAFLVSAREITDTVRRERRLRRELAKALKEACSASQAKTDFLLNMSHDIRTPMNAILGFIDLANREAENSGKVRSALGKARRSGEHLLNLINDILDMSRIESGKMTLNREIIDVREHVSRLEDMFRTPMEEKGLTLQVSADMHTPYIYGDYLRITQVTANLLSNAMKFTPPGGRVFFHSVELPGQKEGTVRYEIHIRDTGIGMDEEFQKRMFGTFERAENSTVSGVQGTGLGLAISRKLVELMGGDLRCTSRMGEGTEFVFSFQVPVAPAPSRQESDPSPDLKGKRILLVEDNELNREIAREILTGENMEVTEAANGAQAVECVRLAKPGDIDAVLMDIQMPVMDGYEATRQIRRLPDPLLSGIPIIAMTADAFAEDKRRALEAGMNDHIAKPVNVKTLLTVLAKYICKDS